MRIWTLVVGPLMTNCYIVADDESPEAVVIDPGGDAHAILDDLEEHGLTAKYIIDTHGHFDHTDANDAVKKLTGASLCASPADEVSGADVALQGGTIISAGNLQFNVFSTPGHSPGSISLMAGNALFSGDLVFAGSIGRTDFPGGSMDAMKESLNWLMTLPDEMTIYPGHGESFRLGHEKATNPYIIWATSNG